MRINVCICSYKSRYLRIGVRIEVSTQGIRLRPIANMIIEGYVFLFAATAELLGNGEQSTPLQLVCLAMTIASFAFTHSRSSRSK